MYFNEKLWQRYEGKNPLFSTSTRKNQLLKLLEIKKLQKKNKLMILCIVFGRKKN